MKTKEELLNIYSSYLPYELQIRYKDFPNEKIIEWVNKLNSNQ